jgi:hypothetical protein
MKAGKLGLRRREGISEDSEADQRIALQLMGEVQSVFAKPALAGRESADQANLH